jgi:hypothetical protein
MQMRILLTTLMATVFASSAVHAADQFWMNYVDSRNDP